MQIGDDCILLNLISSIQLSSTNLARKILHNTSNSLKFWHRCSSVKTVATLRIRRVSTTGKRKEWFFFPRASKQAVYGVVAVPSPVERLGPT